MRIRHCDRPGLPTRRRRPDHRYGGHERGTMATQHREVPPPVRGADGAASSAQAGSAMSDHADQSWPDRLQAATASFSWDDLSLIDDQYVRHLRSAEELVPQDDASRMLGLLRGVRRYAELHAV